MGFLLQWLVSGVTIVKFVLSPLVKPSDSKS